MQAVPPPPLPRCAEAFTCSDLLKSKCGKDVYVGLFNSDGSCCDDPGVFVRVRWGWRLAPAAA